MSPLATIGLAFCTSFFYVLASYFMKLTSTTAIWALMPLGFAALFVGGLFEVEAMKTSRMGAVFIFILCFEAILIALCAVIVLGETYTLREIAGLTVIVAGIALVSWPKGETPSDAVATEGGRKAEYGNMGTTSPAVAGRQAS
jgi:drug/metabolite transporter (DMT)-like permease